MPKLKKDINYNLQDKEKDLTFSAKGVEVIEVNSEGGKKRLKIQGMESGWNLNDIYFPKEMLQEIANSVMKKPKIYVNHDIFSFGSRNVLEWAATYLNAEYEEKEGKGYLVGEIEFTENPNTSWIFNEAMKDPANIEFSTHLRVVVNEEGEADGRKGMVAKVLAGYKSTDIVSYGAAGGRVLKVLNSLTSKPELLSNMLEVMENPEFEEILNTIINKNPKGEMMEIKNLEDLKALFPEIYNALVAEAKSVVEVENQIQEKTTLIETLNAKVTDLETNIVKLSTDLETANTSLSSVTAERDEYKLKIDAMEAQSAKLEWERKVDVLIEKAQLNSHLLTPFFKSQLYLLKTEEDVNVMLEDRKKPLEAIDQIISVGSPTTVTAPETPKKLTDEEIVNRIKGK